MRNSRVNIIIIHFKEKHKLFCILLLKKKYAKNFIVVYFPRSLLGATPNYFRVVINYSTPFNS